MDGLFKEMVHKMEEQRRYWMRKCWICTKWLPKEDFTGESKRCIFCDSLHYDAKLQEQEQSNAR